MNVWFSGQNLTIGENTIINRGCKIDARGGVSIGSNVSVSPYCYIITASHEHNSPDFRGMTGELTVKIGDFSWIGASSIILPGVTIGEGAVIGAGSVVTRNVPPFSIVAGNPASKIGDRDSNLNYSLNWHPLFDTDISI